jgi:hypothetical protein
MASISSIMCLKIMTSRGKDYRNIVKRQDGIVIGILLYNYSILREEANYNPFIEQGLTKMTKMNLTEGQR